MGVATGLFFSANDSEKQTLHRRITPSDEQFEEQQVRWNSLAEHLRSDLRKRSDCAIRSWLQGSYKFGTQVRPPRIGDEFDIDLGIYFEWSGEPEEGEHDARDLRAMVQDSLSAYAHEADGVREVIAPPKARCSRIRYDNRFHIDVPSYHLDADRDARRLAAKGGWEVSDPKELYIWWKNELDEARRVKARRHVRYLKCWAALKFELDNGRPSSVLLTVLVAQAIANLTDEDLASDDDALRRILEEIADRLHDDQSVTNPANESEDLNRLTAEERNAFIKAIQEFRDLAIKACECESEFEAATTWSNAFLHFFPMPDIDTVTETLSKSGAALVPITMPDVAVTATPRNNPQRVFRGVNHIGPIPKGCDITFELVDPWKLPQGTVIEWTVRNEGTEAEEINDLGHVGGIGTRRVESSAYKGTHYMDCVFRRNGRIIAARRIPVQIAGTEMPARNPVRRPAWVQLRGRR